MLRAAMAAPSAGNQQPWHFVVVTDKALLAKVPEIHPHASMAPKAPLGVIVCGDPDLEKHKGYWVQDCSAAVENLLIAAHALGLGAVWTGIHPRDERAEGFRKLFHIPAHVVPLAFIPIGYPAEEKLPANRFQPSRVHDNTWGNIEG
jgi:nitroreductase